MAKFSFSSPLRQAVEEMGFTFKQSYAGVATEASAKDWSCLCGDSSEPLLYYWQRLVCSPQSPPKVASGGGGDGGNVETGMARLFLPGKELIYLSKLFQFQVWTFDLSYIELFLLKVTESRKKKYFLYILIPTCLTNILWKLNGLGKLLSRGSTDLVLWLINSSTEP